MKIAAIIAEYNPFHEGHKYHIKQTREVAGATHVVAVMSGNFTQRGDVAILDKHIRAKAALENGVDLVVELPVAFALSSAEQFASGAVHIVNSLGCVDILSFGSECGKVELIEEAAGAVHYAQDTEELYALMKKGLTYPMALQQTIENYYTEDVVEVLTEPNNTLGVEYVKALNEAGSRIKPFTVKRVGSGHDEFSENTDGILCASQLRKIMLEEGGDYADIKRLETAVLAKLRMMSPKEIKKAPNVQSGLENRIFKAVRAAKSLPELYFLIKTKRYTLARIRRAVMCCFLDISNSDVKLMPQYVRILGMNEKGREILSMAKDCPLPIDTSLSALMKHGDNQRRQALLEERCSNVFALAYEKNRVCGGEFTAKPVVL
ncbi:MAG: nucleotidyltransferase family protein [Oscillospiraceae bacterium]|nr:nucleotidyltransferase family protein [Oscillospiraceae bacterium]